MNKSTFAVTDLHGNYEIWEKIKEYLRDEDTLICLGDCIDRGKRGIEIVNDMRQRPNTIYLKGNHEDMAATAIYDLQNISHLYSNSGDLWFYNGGYLTYKEIEALSDAKQLEYARFFNSLPMKYEYINDFGEKIILTHAGFTPGKREDLLWDRASFHDKWPAAEKSNIKIIHGHTPVHYLEFHYGYDYHLPQEINDTTDSFKSWDPHAIWYCGGHKCDIDLGTAYSNRAMLLDLDTWEALYFE